jgi:hypothetical protein
MGDRDLVQEAAGEFILQIEALLEQQKSWGKSCCDEGCGCH